MVAMRLLLGPWPIAGPAPFRRDERFRLVRTPADAALAGEGAPAVGVPEANHARAALATRDEWAADWVAQAARLRVGVDALTLAVGLAGGLAGLDDADDRGRAGQVLAALAELGAHVAVGPAPAGGPGLGRGAVVSLVAVPMPSIPAAAVLAVPTANLPPAAPSRASASPRSSENAVASGATASARSNRRRLTIPASVFAS
jgi:hypothetical protein